MKAIKKMTDKKTNHHLLNLESESYVIFKGSDYLTELSSGNEGNKKDDWLKNQSSFLLNIESGSYLSSREATLRVLSAQAVFTTVFGMGTGGILPPGHRKIRLTFGWLGQALNRHAESYI